jgi:hypothetical protein
MKIRKLPPQDHKQARKDRRIQVAEEVIVSLDGQGSRTDPWLKPNHLDCL